MTAVTSLAGMMEKHVLGQSLIRRNPFFYDRSREVLAQGEDANLEQRLAWSERQVRRTLQLATRTGYGRSVNAADRLQTWPLLEKECLCHGLQSFITGNGWLSAAATTGVPLKVALRRHGVEPLFTR
jgi:hypothetical protein